MASEAARSATALTEAEERLAARVDATEASVRADAMAHARSLSEEQRVAAVREVRVWVRRDFALDRGRGSPARCRRVVFLARSDRFTVAAWALHSQAATRSERDSRALHALARAARTAQETAEARACVDRLVAAVVERSHADYMARQRQRTEEASERRAPIHSVLTAIATPDGATIARGCGCAGDTGRASNSLAGSRRIGGACFAEAHVRRRS